MDIDPTSYMSKCISIRSGLLHSGKGWTSSGKVATAATVVSSGNGGDGGDVARGGRHSLLAESRRGADDSLHGEPLPAGVERYSSARYDGTNAARWRASPASLPRPWGAPPPSRVLPDSAWPQHRLASKAGARRSAPGRSWQRCSAEAGVRPRPPDSATVLRS